MVNFIIFLWTALTHEASKIRLSKTFVGKMKLYWVSRCSEIGVHICFDVRCQSWSNIVGLIEVECQQNLKFKVSNYQFILSIKQKQIEGHQQQLSVSVSQIRCFGIKHPLPKQLLCAFLSLQHHTRKHGKKNARKSVA